MTASRKLRCSGEFLTEGPQWAGWALPALEVALSLQEALLRQATICYPGGARRLP